AVLPSRTRRWRLAGRAPVRGGSLHGGRGGERAGQFHGTVAGGGPDDRLHIFYDVQPNRATECQTRLRSCGSWRPPSGYAIRPPLLMPVTNCDRYTPPSARAARTVRPRYGRSGWNWTWMRRRGSTGGPAAGPAPPPPPLPRSWVLRVTPRLRPVGAPDDRVELGDRPGRPRVPPRQTRMMEGWKIQRKPQRKPLRK